jgi:hypothetical protein
MRYKKFSYEINEKERFYKKLGYNLQTSNFTQGKTKLRRFNLSHR